MDGRTAKTPRRLQHQSPDAPILTLTRRAGSFRPVGARQVEGHRLLLLHEREGLGGTDNHNLGFARPLSFSFPNIFLDLIFLSFGFFLFSLGPSLLRRYNRRHTQTTYPHGFVARHNPSSLISERLARHACWSSPPSWEHASPRSPPLLFHLTNHDLLFFVTLPSYPFLTVVSVLASVFSY